MFKFDIVKNVINNKSNCYRIFYNHSTTSLHATKSRNVARYRYIYGTVVVTGGLLSCGTWVTWCACQGSNVFEQKGDTGLIKWRRSAREIFNDKVVNSSTFRFGRAARAVVSVFIDYKYTLSGVEQGTDEYKRKKSECHLRSAIRFRDLCNSNGGVFMKVGQHIGSLDFLFPKEYTETLKCFQYKAPESPIQDIKYVIEADTLQAMSEMFTSFDEKPIGSASLAQVHLATLKNGEKVAVKVQHKTVKIHAFQDSKVIEFFANVASKIFPEFQFQWLVDQIKKNLPLELDFLNEGHNCEKMGTYLEKFPNISVPKIFWEQSTQRVLFMEYMSGGAVDDLDYIKKNKLNVNQISSLLGKLYSEMIFVRGDIHCDPHAGNILVRSTTNGKGVEVILLDHGLYVKMEDDVRLNYCKLWQSMIEKDITGIKKYSTALGVGEYHGLFACMVAGRSWESISKSGITNKTLTASELTEIQEDAVEFLSQITDVLEKMPRELVMIFKTNDLLRGLDARLKTSAASASFINMSKSCLRSVYEEEYTKCENMTSKLMLYSKLQWNRLRLILYQLSLSSPNLTLSDAFTLLREGIVGLLDSINNLPMLLKQSVT